MLLVLGAAGGVGLAAVQIGKVCGAIVIAVARYLFQYSIDHLYILASTLHGPHFCARAFGATKSCSSITSLRKWVSFKFQGS